MDYALLNMPLQFESKETLWNRKGTQWATWRLIWSLWVSKGLKWTHFEWPYFAVAKLGLNWSQSVSFWVATTKFRPPTVSNGLILSDSILQRLKSTQLVSISLIWSGHCKAPPTWTKMDSFSVILSGLHPRVIMSFILMFVHMYLLVPEHLVLWAPFTDMD